MSPDVNWVPLVNMTNDQVKQKMLNSKVYIDFGNHPGKDRFPREAAISGCCIITGKRGAANYYEDVRIPEKFKFNQYKTKPENIIHRIRECLDSFEIIKEEQI